MKDYILNILVGLDQLGNTIAGGNPDVTISGHVGFNSYTTGLWYWRLLERIIDFTFKPVDGVGHCYLTYLNDNDVDYNSTDSSLWILALFVVTACFVLIPIIRVIALFV